ncbi:MAG: hypothetical protein JOS17DRAFT_727634 [Linnemannia elongata]|nr:MAG: hypothetical protein JOS17DRAFT_727634 [Linnemannia elongata]
MLLLLELLDLLGLLHGKGHGRGHGNLKVLSIRGLGDRSIHKDSSRLLELLRLELPVLSHLLHGLSCHGDLWRLGVCCHLKVLLLLLKLLLLLLLLLL